MLQVQQNNFCDYVILDMLRKDIRCMKVIKRDGHMVDWCPEKVEAAIIKANNEVEDEDQASGTQIKNIIKYIERLGKKRILVEDIQDIIEMKLMSIGKYELAKKYITYRYTRELVRKSNTTDLAIKELIDGESEYWNTENSNKNAKIVTTQRDYLAGITSTDITRRFLLPEDIVAAHDAGIIHFHDADYFAQNALHNCDLINLEDMLQNGTSINGVMIEKPHRFLTAMTIATQIITAVNSIQYGGCTVTLTHLAPFIRSSRQYYEKKYKESLSIRELTILSLYMIFPDDDKFMNMLYNYNYDFNKVAKLYSINCTVVRLRYDCYMSLKNTKILELK